jgi:hypothetical protein
MRCMGNRTRGWIGLSIVAIACAVGCGGSDEGGSSGQPSSRSPACQKFQAATCDFASRCAAASKDQCLTLARATFCTSDEEAESCAATLNESSCTDDPPCRTTTIDKAKPMALCNQYLEAACSYIRSCDSTVTADECQSEVSSRIDCSTVVAATESIDECLDQLATTSCNPLAIPDACKGSLLSTSPSTG